ncbi:MAG: FAD-dependent oxidoreductase [Clostridia bacterium]|nr:FAD-dependent oxidoreductase [Clostridia bacterium]
MKINETFQTQVTKECDVFVAGGGIAGISAALAAAREGAKVILAEREFALGGLATAGLITIYLPLCDGMGRQVSFGLAEELLRLSVKDDLIEDKNPIHWFDDYDIETRAKAERYEVRFNAQYFALLAEKELLKAGVEILYGTLCCGVDIADRHIDHIVCENKSGRFAVKVGSVVDCTGDADICYRAGVATEKFGKGNVLAAWHYSLSDSEGYKLRMKGAADVPDEVKNKVDYGEQSLNNKRYSGLDGDELSGQVIDSHSVMLADIVKARGKDKSYMPVTMPTIPQVRMTRRIVGAYTLDTAEEHTFVADSIGMVSDWRRRGPVWEVPFGTLYGKDAKNLITAGRNTSVTDNMWDVMRVIPCCAVTGQAAGIAAAMTDDFDALDVTQLQEKLKNAGVILHEKDL